MAVQTVVVRATGECEAIASNDQMLRDLDNRGLMVPSRHTNRGAGSPRSRVRRFRDVEAVHQVLFRAWVADSEVTVSELTRTGRSRGFAGPAFLLVESHDPSDAAWQTLQHLPGRLETEGHGTRHWGGPVPLPLLSRARIEIRQVFPVPVGCALPLSREDIDPLSLPEQKDLTLAHQAVQNVASAPEPWEAAFYRPDLVLGEPMLEVPRKEPVTPVTTPREAGSLSPQEWRRRLGPYRYWTSRAHHLSAPALQVHQDPPERHVACGTCGQVLSGAGAWSTTVGTRDVWALKEHDLRLTPVHELVDRQWVHAEHSAWCPACGALIGTTVTSPGPAGSPPVTNLQVATATVARP
ncbi:hypothetical protein I6B53_10575 [Schaalia sp. 19OD2882]|uniref:hypothetical protein n=1 Tax=Schaalia sp. 19OD2882 TaxID=2794089 RepID=UPI001C1F1DAF|nr:hypothetical protein [Schaalia sp. 19OD2882]QWW19505.1 hypothetical protein I6B53_10575 [Schaalia sp. 19OD2882]